MMLWKRELCTLSDLILPIILLTLVVSYSPRSISDVKILNDRPIIGVMTQASSSSLLMYGDTYLPATYVKFIESAGARVVPILVNQSTEYYDNLFKSINGVLWPGGALDDFLDSGYGQAGKIIYDLAVRSNQAGDYFPIWGTCQGFDLMVSLAAGKNVLDTLKSIDKNLDLILAPDALQSKLLSGASEKVLNALTTKAVTYNLHELSLTLANFSKYVKLSSSFKVLSMSKNAEEKVFVSMVEGKEYPFYAVQFHPEKPLFAWAVNTRIKHDPTTIMVSEYFANFFVNEARLNNHTFAKRQEEEDALIFNYPMVYLRGKEIFDQAYFFNISYQED